MPESFIQLAQMYGKTLEEILTICFESLLQYMITDVTDATDDSRLNGLKAYNTFRDIYKQETTYEASTIPTNVLKHAHMLKDVWHRKYNTIIQEIDKELTAARNINNEEEIKRLIEEQEEQRLGYEDVKTRTTSEFLQYCWDTVNDPKLVFTSDDNKTLLRFFVKLMADQLPLVGQVNSRRQQDQVSPPPPERERRGDPSEASEAFLATKRTLYEDALRSALTAARRLADGKEKNDAVYHAFKTAFGRMLGETRAHCFTGDSFSTAQSWMQQQAAQDITKAQWLKVLKESNALWHAVVLAFRVLYDDLKHDVSGNLTGIQVSEAAQYTDGSSIPTHHISDMRIWLTWAKIDVARGRWRTYVRKEFAENTEHFVREYQTLLMKRYNKVKGSMFGFWFYPSDLCRWVKDLQTSATMGNEDTRDSGYKRFRWPASCRKGESMADGSADSIAYKNFCRMNRLSSNDPRSRLQFCMRMRAAWLRVVACYPYTKDSPAPTDEQIKGYLEQQHIYEIIVCKKDNGAMDWRIENNREVLLQPRNYDLKDFKREDLRDHRVLVYGAPMRCAGAAANPYLCASSLQ